MKLASCFLINSLCTIRTQHSNALECPASRNPQDRVDGQDSFGKALDRTLQMQQTRKELCPNRNQILERQRCVHASDTSNDLPLLRLSCPHGRQCVGTLISGLADGHTNHDSSDSAICILFYVPGQALGTQVGCTRVRLTSCCCCAAAFARDAAKCTLTTCKRNKRMMWTAGLRVCSGLLATVWTLKD